jgi:uncharacterized protein YcgL (UPF0745 family)
MSGDEGVGNAGVTSVDKPEQILCQVFRSPRRAGTYLFVDRSEGISRVPEELCESFGEPELVVTIKLSANRQLGQADAAAVLAAIRGKGFYLQLPPAVDYARGSQDVPSGAGGEPC